MPIDPGTWLTAGATFAAGLTGVIPSFIIGRRKGKEAVTSGLEAQSVALQSESSSNHGWTVEKVFSGSTIDEEGNSTLVRRWTGVKAQGERTVPHLPGSFWVSTPGSQIDAPQLISESFPKDVQLHLEEDGETSCRYRVDIQPPLKDSDPPLTYEVSTYMPKSVLMSRSEVDDAYRNDLFRADYYAFDIDTPTTELTIQVELPETTRVKLFPVVFFTRTEIRNDKELERVEPYFRSIAPAKAQLTVPSPGIGFRYAVYWLLER